MRCSHVTAFGALFFACACAPEEPPPPPTETAVAPGWVLSRPFPETLSLQDVSTVSPTRAYAVGTGGTLLRYEAGTWTREDLPADVEGAPTLESVSSAFDAESGVEIVMAAGEGGLVLLRDDAGWRRLESGTTAHLFGVWLRRLDDAFIVGDDGTILRWRDGALASMDAEALQDRTLPDGTVEQYRIPEALKSVAGGGGRVYAVGLAGSVYVYDFEAQRWTRDRSGTSRPFTDVFTGAGVLATATDGVVFRRLGEPDDRGDIWSPDLRTPVPLYLQGVWGTGGDDVYAVGMAGSVFHWDGSAWATTKLADDAHLRAIDGVYIEVDGPEPTIERTVFAVGAGGRVLRGPSALPDDDRPETEQPE